MQNSTASVSAFLIWSTTVNSYFRSSLFFFSVRIWFSRWFFLFFFFIEPELYDCLFVRCLTSQQHASVSQGRICSDKCMCCHTELKVADQTFHLTQSQYIDTGPASPSADPVPPGAWQGSTGVPIFKSLTWLDPGKIPLQAGFEPGIFRSRGERLNH